MKKYIALLAIMMIIFSTNVTFAKIKVVTTLNDLNAIVKEVGGTRLKAVI